ncbi:Protein AMBP [Triplophysa tibetana]|uniref:Protein AMBP n=1 Tax=Triplophysa tibetana TaxID=1572043 RepID=A0A5A9N3R6_9TELE|nr:Protein AMBP [Triplophysa tibetana]
MMRLLVGFLLAFVALLHAGHSEPQTQENFDVNRFMGKWFDIARASTFPWLKRYKGEGAIGSLELKSSGSSDMISMTRTSFRHDTCKSISREYQMTTTPGKFRYHVSKWNADVDVYVVDTNYDEYALVVMYKQKSGGEEAGSVKLYGRTRELRPAFIEYFKALVAKQGMSEDSIFMNKNKGECVPVEQPMPEPQIQRARRNVVVPPPEVGSGGDTPMFRPAEACKAPVDSGPCFGKFQRYFYNSSIMSCQMFTYGGCKGNHNNFMTQKECLQSCRTEGVFQ